MTRQQCELFDREEYWVCDTLGSFRNHLGRAVEELAAFTIGGEVVGDGQKAPVYDVVRGETVYECKAVGNSRQCMIYKFRLEADQEFVKSGGKLCYLVCHHSMKWREEITVADIRRELPGCILGWYIVPFPKVVELCTKVVKLNSGAYGNPESRYSEGGYRFALSKIERYRLGGG